MVHSWEGEGGKLGKSAGIKKHKIIGTDRQENVKNGIGSGVTKEICMTHGHELRRVLLEGWGYQVDVGKGEKLGQI